LHHFVNHFPPAGEQRVKEALSPDTYQRYLEAQSVENKRLIMFAYAYDLDDDTFDRLRAFRDSAPPNRDREAFQAFSNSVSTLLNDRVPQEFRRREAIEQFFRTHLLFMRPKNQR
jgi:hypothetical protein